MGDAWLGGRERGGSFLWGDKGKGSGERGVRRKSMRRWLRKWTVE